MQIRTLTLGPLETNCYILTDPETGDTAVIDPGLDEEQLLDLCKPIAKQIKWLLLTHSHFDHIMGLAALKELTGAPVAVHRLDADGLTDPRASMYRMCAQYYAHPQQPAPPDRLLEDGDELPLGGGRIRVLHTPGHTVGGVCFLTDDALFSGDTLFAGGVGRTDFPGGDYSALRESLQRLAALEGDLRVFPGHGPATTLGRERRENPYIGQDNDDAFAF